MYKRRQGGGQTRFFLKKPIGCSESNITTILFEDSPNKWSPYVATCLVIILTQVPKPQILVSVSNPIYTLNFFIRTTFFKYLSCFLKMLGTTVFKKIVESHLGYLVVQFELRLWTVCRKPPLHSDWKCRDRCRGLCVCSSASSLF